MVSTIYITRHGFRSNWVPNVPVPPSPTGLSIDPVLAEHGIDQANELGEYLKDVSPKIQRIYCSPFYRCLQTAQPTARLLGLPILVENGLGEWFQWRKEAGLSPADLKTLKGFFPEIDETYSPAVVPSINTENRDELQRRCMETISHIVEDLNKNHPEVEAVLFVGHAASKAALGAELTGDYDLTVRTGVCSVDKYELKPGRSGENHGDWNITLNGYTGHLKDGEEMHWTFGSNEDIEARKAQADIEAKAKAEKEQEQKEGKQNENQKENNEELTTVYVPIEMAQVYNNSGVRSSADIPTQAEFQSSGLETDVPLFKIGPNIYQGSWNNMVGTEVFTTAEGEVIGKSRQRILLDSKPLELSDNKEVESKKVSLMDRIREINLRKQDK